MFSRRRTTSTSSKNAAANLTVSTGTTPAPPLVSPLQMTFDFELPRPGSAVSSIAPSTFSPTTESPLKPWASQGPSPVSTENRVGSGSGGGELHIPLLPVIPRVSSARSSIADPSEHQGRARDESDNASTTSKRPATGSRFTFELAADGQLPPSPAISHMPDRPTTAGATPAIMQSSLFPSSIQRPATGSGPPPTTPAMSRAFIDSRDRPYNQPSKPSLTLQPNHSSPSLLRPRSSGLPTASPLSPMSASKAWASPQSSMRKSKKSDLSGSTARPSTRASTLTANSASTSTSPAITIGTPYQSTADSFPLPQLVKTRPKTPGPTATIGGVAVPTHHTSLKVEDKESRKKNRLTLNPLALLQRRKSNQDAETGVDERSQRLAQAQALARQKDVLASGVNKPPPDYDPSIRGNLVHDFSAPRRSRNTFDEATDSAQRSSGLQSAQGTSIEHLRRDASLTYRGSGESNYRRSTHTPVFVEHLSENPEAARRISSIQAENLENKDFLQRASKQSSTTTYSQESAVLPPFARRSQTLDPMQASLYNDDDSRHSSDPSTEPERDSALSSFNGVSPVTAWSGSHNIDIRGSLSPVSPSSPSKRYRPASEASKAPSHDSGIAPSDSQLSKASSQDQSRPASNEAIARVSAHLAPPSISTIAERSTENIPVEPPFGATSAKEPQFLASSVPAKRDSNLARMPTPRRGLEQDVGSIQRKSVRSQPRLGQKRLSGTGRSQKGSSLPKHQPSNASRFSFQSGPESAAQEHALEEKHRQIVENIVRGRSPSTDGEDDYFDEDAIDDMDEIEIEAATQPFAELQCQPTAADAYVQHGRGMVQILDGEDESAYDDDHSLGGIEDAVNEMHDLHDMKIQGIEALHPQSQPQVQAPTFNPGPTLPQPSQSNHSNETGPQVGSQLAQTSEVRPQTVHAQDSIASTKVQSSPMSKKETEGKFQSPSNQAPAPSQSSIYLRQAREVLQGDDTPVYGDYEIPDQDVPYSAHSALRRHSATGSHTSRQTSAFGNHSRQASSVGGPDGYWRGSTMDFYMRDPSEASQQHSRQGSDFNFDSMSISGQSAQASSPLEYRGFSDSAHVMSRSPGRKYDHVMESHAETDTPRASPDERPLLPSRDSGNSERNRVASGMSFNSPSVDPKVEQNTSSQDEADSAHGRDPALDKLVSDLHSEKATSTNVPRDTFKQDDSDDDDYDDVVVNDIADPAYTGPPGAQATQSSGQSSISRTTPRDYASTVSLGHVKHKHLTLQDSEWYDTATEAGLASQAKGRTGNEDNHKVDNSGIISSDSDALVGFDFDDRLAPAQGIAIMDASDSNPDPLASPEHRRRSSAWTTTGGAAVSQSFGRLASGDVSGKAPTVQQALAATSNVTDQTEATESLRERGWSPLEQQPLPTLGSPTLPDTVASSKRTTASDLGVAHQSSPVSNPPEVRNALNVGAPTARPNVVSDFNNDDIYFDDGNFDQDISDLHDTSIDETVFDDDAFLTRPGMLHAVNHRRDRSSTALPVTSMVSDGPYPTFARPNPAAISQRYSRMTLEDVALQGPVDPKLIPQRNPSEDMKRLGLSDRIPPVPVPESNKEAYARMQSNLQNYHAALADAATKAAADGRFKRAPSISTTRSESVKSKGGQGGQIDQDAKSIHDDGSVYSNGEEGGLLALPSNDGDGASNLGRSSTAVSVLTHQTTYSPPKMNFDFGFDEIPQDELSDAVNNNVDDYDYDGFGNEDDLIAAANAEALAIDEDGFYGQEFDFYGRPRANSEDLQPINGGFFGADGDTGLERNRSLREPNLTPITERSEFSTRNSFVGPVVSGQFGPTGAGLYGPHSPAAMGRMSVTPVIENEPLSFDELRRVKANAFGDSSSLRSSSNRSSAHSLLSGFSPTLNTRHSVTLNQYGPLGGIPMQFAYSTDSSASSNPISAHPMVGQTHQDSPHSASSSQGMPFALDADATPKKNTGSPQVVEPPSTSRKVPPAPTPLQTQMQAATNGQQQPTHSRKGSDSVTYVREEDPERSGKPRWVLERRRTSEQGQLELIGRELVQGGWI